MKRIHWLCLTVFGVFLGQAAGQNPNALGLQQAVDSALETHPMMRAARLSMEQAGNRATEARAERVPKIRVSETLTRGNNPVFVFGSLLEQARFGAQNFALPALNNPQSTTNLRTVLSTSLPLFDGMRTSAHIDQASINRDQAGRQQQLAEQRVRFEVISDYFGLLVAETAVKVSGEAMRTAESDIQRARDRFDAGLAVQSDVLAAQVQLAEFKQQRIQAEGDAATALAALNISMGSPAGTQRTLTVELLKKKFDLAPLDDLVDRALRHRPDQRHAEGNIDLADRRIVERRSEYFPELGVFASLGSSGRSLFSGSADYSIGASASFNIFDRGRPARIGQALVDKRLAETERDRVADQIRLEVVRAYNRYRAAEEQVEVAEAALAQASEGLRIIQDRYQAGLTTITDVFRAETTLVRIRMAAVVSRRDHYLGYAAVLMSTGQLNDVSAFEP
jgi:outer membrane protein TolC